MKKHKKKLIDICNIQYGYAFDSKQFTDVSTDMPLIRIRDVKRGYSDTYYSGDYNEAYIVNAGDILIGMDGEFNIAKWNSRKALLNQRVCKIIGNENVVEDYLVYYLRGVLKEIEAKTSFATVKHLSAKVLNSVELTLHEIDDQTKISKILNNAKQIIDNRQKQLIHLDDLIKSRFVEMFGDPVENPKNWEVAELSNLADIKIGPFGSLLHKEDYVSGGHALVNPSHIVDGKICCDENLTISNEKYDELKSYNLEIDDVILGRRGEMGRCAVVNQEGLLCGTGSIRIRSTGYMRPYILQKIISFPTYKKLIEDKAVGQTMMNLNVPIVSKFEMPKIPKKVQDEYLQFVHQVDKLKVEVQKSLDESQVLFDSLMQEYFE